MECLHIVYRFRPNVLHAYDSLLTYNFVCFRAHRNDLENILIFFVAAFCYIMTNPSPALAVMLMRIFTVARIAHTIVYAVIVIPQPARAIAFFVGYFITAYMALMAILTFAA